MIVALFDADGTLYTAPFGLELTKHLNSQGRRWYGSRYLASVYLNFFLSKLKALSQEKFQRSILSGLNGLMQGCTEEYAREAYRWMLEHVASHPCPLDDRYIEQQTADALEAALRAEVK